MRSGFLRSRGSFAWDFNLSTKVVCGLQMSFYLWDMKKPILYLVIGLCSICVCTACFPIRSMFLGFPDVSDQYRFHRDTIQQEGRPFHFAEVEDETWGERLRVNDWTTDLPVFKPIGQVLREHETNAMVIIRRDTILYEYYREGMHAGSLQASFSVAKSVTSALIGFAIQEGYIKGVDELIVDYIPELSKVDGAEYISIRHLLNQTSGIKYDFFLDSHLYYGNDIWKGIKRMKMERLPGTHQAYLNINIQLLGIIIKRATAQSPSEYLERHIWKPLGMESEAWWSTDKKGVPKTYCCMSATARDYARFGRLYLNRGKWNGEQLLEESWIEQSLKRDTTQGSSHGYQYCWHLGLEESGDYMAKGMLKQRIYIHPEKEVIIVLFNGREGKVKRAFVKWDYILRQLADML